MFELQRSHHLIQTAHPVKIQHGSESSYWVTYAVHTSERVVNDGTY